MPEKKFVLTAFSNENIF